MSNYTLTLLDATGIQEYIFGSNQLAQNIGASELVERVTTQWLVENLEVLGLSTNLRWNDDTGLEYSGVPAPQVDVEVIYAGGGNAVLLFAPGKDAQAFLRYHTRRVLKEARGMQTLAVSQGFEWDENAGTGESIVAVLDELRKKIFKRKMSSPASTPLPGLAITTACAYTGLPAAGDNLDVDLVGPIISDRFQKLIGKDPNSNLRQPISREVADKLRAEPPAKERLHGLLKQVREKGFEFVYDFDQFGEKGESSYIAIVHTDGNGMGKRFEALAEQFKTVGQNRQYIEALRALSDSIRKRAQKALSETVDYLLDGLEKEEITILPIKRDGTPLLPFRPIVFGGDDVTFVCDGRLGLLLAAKYLQVFTDGNLADSQPVYARAGVAVVKTHFPFSRAYNLSEDLADSAKQAIAVLKQKGEASATVLDWHFSTTGVIRSLGTIREQDYKTYSEASVLMRPIRVNSGKGEWRSWDSFQNLIQEFLLPKWADKRNKVKDLQSALLHGSQQVTVFMKNHRESELPEILANPKMKLNGWQVEDGKDIACGYFDALEALDFVAVKAKQEAL